MARNVRVDKILNAHAERILEHHRLLKRNINQRRNGLEDLYGQPFIVYGDANYPATFFISISPDYIYLERYAFKFAIQPYQTTVTGGTSSETVTVNNRSLEIEGTGASAKINPNPHNHTTQAHSHNLVTGKSFIHTTSKNWRVKIAGIDITEYLQEQVADVPGAWLGERGEEVYPTRSLEETNKVNFFDILDVANVMQAEGKTDEVYQLLKPELKEVEVISDAPFGIQAYLYLKYSNVNR